MAKKCRVILLLLTLCFFASLISHGIAQNPPSISPTNSNSIDTKDSELECWSLLFDLGWCYEDLVRASQTQSGKVDLSIEPNCCKAARSMNSGCWSKMFPNNPFFPRVFRSYCLRIPFAPPPPSDARSRTPNLQSPSMAIASSPTPMNADAPTPNAEGPILFAPFALPPYAPSPTTDDVFMDTPRDDQGPNQQPLIYF